MIRKVLKILFELQYEYGERSPWKLRAYRRTFFGGKEYVHSWWCETEEEALQIMDKYRAIPMIQYFN